MFLFLFFIALVKQKIKAKQIKIRDDLSRLQKRYIVYLYFLRFKTKRQVVVVVFFNICLFLFLILIFTLILIPLFVSTHEPVLYSPSLPSLHLSLSLCFLVMFADLPMIILQLLLFVAVCCCCVCWPYLFVTAESHLREGQHERGGIAGWCGNKLRLRFITKICDFLFLFLP